MAQHARAGTGWGASALALAILLSATAKAADPLDEGRRALYGGRPAEAAAAAESYLKAHPASAGAWSLLAQSHLATGQFERAHQELQRAVELEPQNQEALYFLVKVSGILSELELQALLAQAPESARAHQVLAEAYRDAGENSKAEREFLAAIEKDPRLLSVLPALGDLKRNQGDARGALPFYERAAAIDPLDHDSAYGLGACYLMLREPGKAIEYFRRAAQADPGSAIARFALADALYQAGKPEAAVPELEAAVSLEPGMRQAYNLLGRIHRDAGRQQEAAQAFQKFRALQVEEMQDQELRFGRRIERLPKATGGAPR